MFTIILVLLVCALLLLGFPVAFTLGGGALLVAGLGYAFGAFDPAFLAALPNRLYGIMRNETLLAVPLFVFMGVMLERARIAENLLEEMAALFGSLRGGLGFSVVIVGMLLAASTGIVGATVVTMGLLSLPTMLRRGYDPALSAGIICASGTLGQIIPPSVILILLGDVLASAYQQAQLKQGVFSPETVSVGDLFAGALLPGLLLVGLYLGYLAGVAWLRPAAMPSAPVARAVGWFRILQALLPPLALILAVLGSILAGIATPTEAAAVGALGALVLAALQRQLNWSRLQEVMQNTLTVTSMVFMILIGASIFTAVFRGFGGDEQVAHFMEQLPGGAWGAFWLVMLLVFLLGFIIDFIEIIFIVVPIAGPILLAMGFDPVWLGVMLAINLQTSFLTPPFGFALFYLRGVAPPEQLSTVQIYRGVVPFIGLQLLALGLVAYWQTLVTWLPQQIYG